MEVISYIGTSEAVRKRNPDSKKMNFTVSDRKAKKTDSFSIIGTLQKSKKTEVLRPFDTKTSSISIKKEEISKKFSEIDFIPLAFIILSVLILAVVPLTVYNLLSYSESHTAPLSFNPNFSDELENLDVAMSKFAMENVVSDVDENGNVLSGDGDVLTPASVGVGQVVNFKTYKVCPGDSISTITRKFGLSNISTLIAVNGIENVRTLRSGQKLRIPSQDGLIHKVGAGDSLNGLSVKYKVSVEELLDANDLNSDVLSKGMELFIPGAKMDSTSLKKAMGELFVCPILSNWRLTSYFGPRKDPFSGVASNHTGIDMACPQGTPIRASMSGVVGKVGFTRIYGNYVIITHDNGYQTLYAHMLKALVTTNQRVDQNTRIGLVGSTGYSTGPHLHFSVYKNGGLVDPLSLIKR